jgi:hypothetical protein
MPTPQLGRQFHPLCYEHHIQMKVSEALTRTEGPPPHILTYTCPQPGCGAHYVAPNGYFVVPKNGNAGSDMTPRVTCARDGQPMYLAEINPEKQDFRLWRCPQCDSTRTNEEGLVTGLRVTSWPTA